MHIFGKKSASMPPSSAPGLGEATGSGAGAVIDVSTATFERDVVQRSLRTPVLVDLWATWCGPCKELGPRLEKMARKAGGAFILAKVDVDANQDIAALFGVRSIPAVILFRDGRPVDAFMGAMGDREIEEFLKRHISLAPPSEERVEEGATVESDLAQGDIRSALKRIDRRTDRLLAARVHLLAGDFKAAKSDLDALDDAARSSALGQVESVRNLIGKAEAPGNDAESKLAELSSRGAAVVLEDLFAMKGADSRSILVELLGIFGRGSFADDYRTRLSRTLFS